MKPVKTDVHFPTLEKEILARWESQGIVEKGLEANKDKKAYVFYDGPPFATGLPHYGHILAGTLKDIVPRYWVMKGRYVQRRWGWDCHGLPVEFEMEKELGLQGRPDVEKFGIAKFNEACRNIVQRYTKEWQEVIERTGRWVDFKNNYRTMDTPYMESVWWVVKQLWDQQLVFEGYRVMPYSWRISTPLSNFEASLNYKEVQDPALTVKFKSKEKNRFLLAWTTTPWTLPANMALSVHPDIDYVEIEDAKTKEHYVLAASRLAAYYKTPEEYSVVAKFKGKTLENESYETIFPFTKKKATRGHFVVLGEHVTEGDGTGIVHTAPAHGEDDFQVCKKYQIPLLDFTDADGKFTSDLPQFAGQFIKDADKEIIKYLKSTGTILRHDTIVHSYPFCWRSDTPLMNKAISTWFVKLDPIKETMMAGNKKTHWVPEHIRDGRFGNWLENARDWNISRNRFWGTPIPIWRCKRCGHMECLGSIAELEKHAGRKLTDIHKHYIDDILIPCSKCPEKMQRIPEVLDCWFESGSMPYAQAHYPFENKEVFDKNFPAEFIAEGVDQTRGWFYTLTVLGAALKKQSPFKNVIVNGLVLAEDGKKMSKRLKNYPDPVYVLDTYGADALRAYLMTSPASHAEELRFSEAGIKELVRSVLLPLWNSYSFLVTYARADAWDASKFDSAKLGKLKNETDRWVVSRLHSLVKSVDEKMAVYHLYEVVPEVVSFIDQLTNWYIRLNRRRFWSDEKNEDKEAAYTTLYYVISEFCKILAPILPFVTEEIYQNLGGKNKAESIHLTCFPAYRADWVSPELEKEMAFIQTVVMMGRNLRNTHNLKTRQPLRELLIISQNAADESSIQRYREMICTELNVKKVSFSTDEAKWVTFTAKPNLKALGPRLGGKMRAVTEKIKQLPPDQLAQLEKKGTLEVEGETISKDDILIDRKSKQAGVIQNSGTTTVWLDTHVDEGLVAEGRAREFVNRVQKLRKDLNFEVTDRIRVGYQCPPDLKQAIETHKGYISAEILSQDLKEVATAAWTSEQDIDGLPLKLQIDRV